tara:strand:- start:347 stop:565 length:219 start_codon:yes stop_codon:yes gene_type:complete
MYKIMFHRSNKDFETCSGHGTCIGGAYDCSIGYSGDNCTTTNTEYVNATPESCLYDTERNPGSSVRKSVNLK